MCVRTRKPTAADGGEQSVEMMCDLDPTWLADTERRHREWGGGDGDGDGDRETEREGETFTGAPSQPNTV